MMQPSKVIQSLSSRQPKHDRWLHVCNGLSPVRDGGMVPSILGMTGALANIGEEVIISTFTPSDVEHKYINTQVALHGPETDINVAVRSATAVHIHGLWQRHVRTVARCARANEVPYIIAAHGMAEPWALRHKKWKKRLYLALVERRNLNGAACLHALSRPEIDHLRRVAPWVPIAYVPNGVDLTSFQDLPPRAILEAAYPQLRDKFVLLFFGRLHVKKGLDLLAKALYNAVSEFPAIHLLIAGTDDGGWKPFYQYIDGLNLKPYVTYLGYVPQNQARFIWAAANAFILPSYSEGFSMAVLEALAYSLPCLITRTCHFPELAEVGGAIVVDAEESHINRGLSTLLRMSKKERRHMAEKGHHLVKTCYTWNRHAIQLAAVYHWLIGGGQRPDCVVY